MKGTLKVKRGYYYAVINYKDNYGKYKQKWFNTGLKERVNKKGAQKISDRFNNILKKSNLRHIRFHDLRHSCVSLLVASKIPMKIFKSG